MTKAILRYLVYFPASIAVTFLVWFLAPIVALPCFVRKAYDGREWYVPWLAWASTHDSPVDTYYFGSRGRIHWLFKRYTYDELDRTEWLRYVNRLLWLYRNPAYTAKHSWFGFNTDGVEPVVDFKGSGVTARCENLSGAKAFLFDREWRFLHLQFGWKLYRNDADNVRMLAFRVKPKFRER